MPSSRGGGGGEFEQIGDTVVVRVAEVGGEDFVEDGGEEAGCHASSSEGCEGLLSGDFGL